jgi:hypothetical protein
LARRTVNILIELDRLILLGNFLRTLATPEPIKDWSLTSLSRLAVSGPRPRR